MLIANWKMHKNLPEVKQWLEVFNQAIEQQAVEHKLAICPAYPYLDLLKHNLPAWIAVGAQNCATEQSGAFTGEVSTAMLKSLGVELVLIGHSERRQGYAETNEIILQKVRQALQAQLKIVLCCGESLENRKAGIAIEFISQQIQIIFDNLTAAEQQQLLIAYEPIWAIGTGLVPTTEELQEMFTALRKLLPQTKLLYGGSVNATNLTGLLQENPNIDGALVGGASLKADEFAAMFKIYQNLR